MTINVRSDTVKNAFRMLIIIYAVFVMCVA